MQTRVPWDEALGSAALWSLQSAITPPCTMLCWPVASVAVKHLPTNSEAKWEQWRLHCDLPTGLHRSVVSAVGWRNVTISKEWTGEDSTSVRYKVWLPQMDICSDLRAMGSQTPFPHLSSIFKCPLYLLKKKRHYHLITWTVSQDTPLNFALHTEAWKVSCWTTSHIRLSCRSLSRLTTSAS